MVDLQVLKQFGLTPETLKSVFTAKHPSADEAAGMTDDEKSERAKLVEIRKTHEDWIQSRLDEHIPEGLKHSLIYQAVDLAMDAAPINKFTVSLMMYAQGRISQEQCVNALRQIPESECYVTETKATVGTGSAYKVTPPKFWEVRFNLVRSVITRRLAAQANKYESLYPRYKYEARSTTQVGKLRADIMSQVIDVQADQFDMVKHDIQCLRDAMMYANCVDFIRSSWTKERQLAFDTDVNPDLATADPNNLPTKEVITKQGISWWNPHPTRRFRDLKFPLSTLNSDTGIKYIGYWDVVTVGDVVDNTSYWNRKNLSYSSVAQSVFASHAQFWSQYYPCTITPPQPVYAQMGTGNDRLSNLGTYASDRKSDSIVVANIFRKVVPKDVGFGTYPYPVWIRFLTAGSRDVLYAEPIASRPGAYLGINENDNRLASCSIAMELLPYEDQLSQLLSLLLLLLRQSNFRVLAINKDLADPESITKFRADAEAQNKYPTCFVFEYSLTQLQQTLPGFKIETFIDMIETKSPMAITLIFEAIERLVKLAERLLALSPQELGQPAPSGISATETNLIGATTETVYGFVSDAMDGFRAAKKQICAESWIVHGEQDFTIPVINRYPLSVIQKAGFKPVTDDPDEEIDPLDTDPKYWTITGQKSRLIPHEWIYSSRDGALRSVNSQSATTLVQLLGVLQHPIIMQKLTSNEKYFEKFLEIINEIFRLSGAGVETKFEMDQGDMQLMGPGPEEQLNQAIEALTANAEQAAQVDNQLGQKLEELTGIVQDLTQQVEAIDRESKVPSIDPLKMATTQAQLEETNQKMRHAEDNHAVELGLKAMEMEQA